MIMNMVGGGSVSPEHKAWTTVNDELSRKRWKSVTPTAEPRGEKNHPKISLTVNGVKVENVLSRIESENPTKKVSQTYSGTTYRKMTRQEVNTAMAECKPEPDIKHSTLKPYLAEMGFKAGDKVKGKVQVWVGGYNSPSLQFTPGGRYVYDNNVDFLPETDFTAEVAPDDSPNCLVNAVFGDPIWNSEYLTITGESSNRSLDVIVTYYLTGIESTVIRV